MGNCYSHNSNNNQLSKSSYSSYPPPLSPPTQDLASDDLLNRWRHGEVTFLRLAFRNAKAVQETILSLSKQPKNSKRGGNSGRVKSSRIGDGECAAHIEKQYGDRSISRSKNSENGSRPLDITDRKLRSNLTEVGFAMIFPRLQDMPIKTHASAFSYFSSNGSEGISFLALLRCLTLCCRGSRAERLRFLLDIISSSTSKYRGMGDVGGSAAHDPPLLHNTIVLTTDEASSLLEWYSKINGVDFSQNLNGLASSSSDPIIAASSSTEFAKETSCTAKMSSCMNVQNYLISDEEGITFGQYFAWAETYLSDELLDSALSPFNILLTPTQERERAVTLLSGFVLTPECTLYAVSVQWWKEWTEYCQFEESAHLMNGHVKALGLVDNSQPSRTAAAGLSSRPHEMDNSPLQGYPEWELKYNLQFRKDFVFVIESLWMELFLWYGGGPAFPRVVGSLPQEKHLNSLSSLCKNVLVVDHWFVDPYPLGVYVTTCGISGYPSALSRLVLCSPYATARSTAQQMLTKFGAACRDDVIFRLWVLVEASTVRSEESLSNVNQCNVERWQLLSETDLNLNLMTLGLGQMPLKKRKLLIEIPVKQSSSTATTTRKKFLHQLKQQQIRGSGGGGDSNDVEGNIITNPTVVSSKDDDRGVYSMKKLFSSITTPLFTSEKRPAAAPAVYSSSPQPPNTVNVVGHGSGSDSEEISLTTQNNENSSSSSAHDIVKSGKGGGENLKGGRVGKEECHLRDSPPHEAEKDSLIWPRNRFVEPNGFREFHVQDCVDIMNFKGRWYLGTVVAVERVKLKGSKGSVPSLVEGPIGKLLKMPGPVHMSEHGVLFPIRTWYANNDSLENIFDTTVSPSTSCYNKSNGCGENRSRSAATTLRKDENEDEDDEKEFEILSVRVHVNSYSGEEWDEILCAESPRLSIPGSYTPELCDEEGQKMPPKTTTTRLSTMEESSSSPHTSRVPNLCQTTQSSAPPATGGGTPTIRKVCGDGNNNSVLSSHQSRPKIMQDATTGGYSSMFQLNMNIIDSSSNCDIKRKGNTLGQPPIPGACGLVNVGNSCYMNSAVQCLSHTPLLRAYILSGMFFPEINRDNPFGSGGILVEEFSKLLKSLWSGDLVCADPIKFKQELGKWKSDFAGNNQQDSQEVIQFMLDGLHEDVNRVLTKQYIPAPDEDENAAKSDELRAAEQWHRHLQLNRSKIVDLFQGQMRTEVVCMTCKNRNVNFDPFMHLSIPIPDKCKVVLNVVLLRCNGGDHTVTNGGPLANTDNEQGERRVGRLMRTSNSMCYIMKALRMGSISDIREYLSKLSGIETQRLALAEVFRGRISQILNDSDTLSAFRTNVLVAYEQPMPIPGLQHNNLMMTKGNGMGGNNGGSSIIKEPNVNNIPHSSSSSAAMNSGGKGHSSTYFNLDATTMDVNNDFDLNESNWPTSIGEVRVHQRFDAMNTNGKWCSGTVVAIIENPIYQVRFHFDYTSKFEDIWVTEKHWRDVEMAPLNSKVKKRSASLNRVIVINRTIGNSSGTSPPRYQRSAASMQQQFNSGDLCQPSSHGRRQKDSLMDNNPSNNYQSSYTSSSEVLIHGTPLLLYCDSRTTVRHIWRLVVRSVAPYISDADLSAEASSVANCEDDIALMQKLPFTVRIVRSKHVLVENAAEELKPDSTKKAVSVLYVDALLTVDWSDHYKMYMDPMEDLKCQTRSDVNNMNGMRAGASLYTCLEKFTNEESMEVNEDDGYYCKNCDAKRAVSTKTDLWKVPDILVVHMKRFFHMGQRREKIRSLVVFPLSGLDITSFVADLSPDRKNANQGGLMYDLYGVLNHMGDMMGGHYTAYCKGTPCTDGGVEELDCSSMDHLWLNFDDEFVEEISPDKIVTESAYVLFYRRRMFTLSNIATNTV